jgi:hypothetical protein
MRKILLLTNLLPLAVCVFTPARGPERIVDTQRKK